jgi:hypothetical protein
MKNFTNGPFAKMFKNMAGGAGLNANAIEQMGKQSAMKERLRKKMEERKMRAATVAATVAATATATASATASATPVSNSFVVKIGDEKQEKSGLKPPAAPLSDKELIDLFKNDKAAKVSSKSKKGKK